MMANQQAHSPFPAFFVLEAFDRDQWCPVLQARFVVAEPEVLLVLLGSEEADDPELRCGYCLDDAELAAVEVAFDIHFDIAALPIGTYDVHLGRLHTIRTAPYLVHTGYELPLLLDGRKKLARMVAPYPPMRFVGEDRFDHWVAEGKLHKQEVVEPHEAPGGGTQGLRTVYFTPSLEAWRIPAMQMVWRAAAKAGGWNRYFERLEGMLFGYEDWQNDWWIEAGMRRGGFGGARLCCAVTGSGLAWLEAAGFRALPPCESLELTIAMYDEADHAGLQSVLLDRPDSVALVSFAIGLWTAHDLLQPAEAAGRWRVASRHVPELNRLLKDPIVVVARRGEPP